MALQLCAAHEHKSSIWKLTLCVQFFVNNRCKMWPWIGLRCLFCLHIITVFVKRSLICFSAQS